MSTPTPTSDVEGQLTLLDEEIKTLREQQKPLSRRIGQAKAGGESADSLLSEMRKLSDQIKQLTAQRKQLMAQSTPSTSSDVPAETALDTHPSKPAYFQNTIPSEQSENLTEVDRVSLDFPPDGIQVCTDSTLWDAYVSKQTTATTYHRFGFLKLIREQHGLKIYPLAARDEKGLITGVLPIVHMNSPLFGSFLVSLPYVNYGGVLADDDVVSAKLMMASRALAEHLGCSHSEIRETSQRKGWFCRQHKASMTRALPNTDKAFDKEIGAKLRSQSRKASAHGAEFKVGGKELLADFYSVFSANMRDLGTPIYRASFFGSLLDLLGDDAFISVVYLRGKPVATGFLIAHGETLEIPWASCRRRANRYDANMFLYRNILAEAIRRKFWHYWLSDPNDPPGLNPDNPKFRLVIAIWRRLPVALTRIIGPPVAKHLP